MSLWTGDYSKYRSQDYLDYQPNGAIYFAKTSAYLKQKHFYGARTLAYEMDAQSSIDIDNEIDAALASLYLHRSEWSTRPGDSVSTFPSSRMAAAHLRFTIFDRVGGTVSRHR